MVGLALDVEGIAPAKIYYEKYGVTFPALVDPNYATGFGAVPKTFFVDEHGVVMRARNWESDLSSLGDVRPVTGEIKAKFSRPGRRFDPDSVAALVGELRSNPGNLAKSVELSSRYIDLGLYEDARNVLQDAVKQHDPKATARGGSREESLLLGQAYLQLSRASVGDRPAQVKYATLSFYLNPSVGFGKQIARMIAPEKFDGRPDGRFDNNFREGTLRRLRKERKEWLAEEG